MSLTITRSLEIITPQIARDLLAKNIQPDPIDSEKVDFFVKLMQSSFHTTPIQIDGAGNLTDGQHRLQAIVRTGLDVAMLVDRTEAHPNPCRRVSVASWGEIKCECGATSCNSKIHSSWCPKSMPNRGWYLKPKKG